MVDLAEIERARVLRAAEAYLGDTPLTITASASPRSAGGRHDYFSEGDYWWPDPANPGGPYVRRDGLSNPDNFKSHQAALRRLSLHVPALVAAWLLTAERRFADDARSHLRAWFLERETRMSPHLLYSQAVRGRCSGREFGVIDGVHLVEVARSVRRLEEESLLPPDERDGIKAWFEEYLTWLTTHSYGIKASRAPNNHATCWAMQVAEYATLVDRPDLTALCRELYRAVLLPEQMAADGSFPEELKRTKPYAYSLFNLDAMATLCQILSTPEEDLWSYKLPDGRGARRAVAFMVPFIADRDRWTRSNGAGLSRVWKKRPRRPDVMYFDKWPVRHPSLLFGGIAMGEESWIELWRRLEPDPTNDEVLRNYFVRQPVLWQMPGVRAS